MTHRPTVEQLAALVGGVPADDQALGAPTVDLTSDQWLDALTTARDAGLAYFDWLTGVDEGDEVGIVVHLYSLDQRHGLLLRTRVARDGGQLPSATNVFPGASWHERETIEMYGVTFDGHPDPRPLLLPDEFHGHPLRKDFVLAARAGRDWPGAVEDPSKTGSRRRLRPPGATGPGTWSER
ncbi:MAG: NADH-quinone oxidoreductase subunit [Frankiales bacterium]|jgi:NADH-quinone oxidoreductase subunit C|nr:NADH-quinone oxidoreductase subunit [Frankiales bacterium]